MIDLKTMKSALDQLEEERGIDRAKVIGAIEDALTAAYKKDYGKRGQIIRARFDLDTGQVEFMQVKIVVDESMLKSDSPSAAAEDADAESAVADEKIVFNEEHHIMLSDARKIKNGAQIKDEIVFPLEAKGDYGRIAAQTAKQVIVQRLREAEKQSVMHEYAGKQGEIITGKVQKIERGNVFVDLGRTTAILPYEEQIPGEYYRQGERLRAYLYSVEETPRGINLRLSRSHPKFVEKLFAIEAPEVASGVVELRAIAREAGSRSKIAVTSSEAKIDPVGSCVGQRGVRVNTVINELSGEKIDIIEWTSDPAKFIANALLPAKTEKIDLRDETKEAKVAVPADQFSLAVGKGGQNVRLAAKLTGWKIDIVSPQGENSGETNHEPVA
ncbi:MAG: transcription termination factor NusA [Patescibacteria group bacterium]